ncbi:hypothetical protein [Siansivirga zeaxanthinifaciens]|uniref:Lipoprotein n=1 Tax=Siansivirga zeaxanthinifaciens CC-SAMT-1 TaxID=1454006 RepID=A0A0C5WDC0_9FLAO|nr:hypothetical protein [Siansivirga zeaxanthinifaciens]AJR03234.1 lipoprotein [Siansivirga zeaxanthinifaciens CC-SAMT-1]
MKKLLLSAVLLTALSLTFTSCKDSNKTVTIEEAVDSAVEATEDAVEATEEAVDDAVEATEEAMDDAAESTKKAVDHTVEAAKELVDKESVTVNYSYKVMGKEIKGSKVFSGHQDTVEKAVAKFSDSIKKLDPKVIIVAK